MTADHICVVMPAWNEEDGIGTFIRELHAALNPLPHEFIVVDDLSTDGTSDAAKAAAATGASVTVFRNESNMGHGPSTLRALTLGLQSGASVVVALDGDGQFNGDDVASLVQTSLRDAPDIIEGVRTSRGDPLYRRGVSLATRALVWSKVGTWPQDANTPLRVYRRDYLARVLNELPDSAMTPNLLISALSRTADCTCVQMPVASRDRLGVSAVGTTWGRGSILPSRRFIKFCGRAAKEWLSYGQGLSN